MSSHVLGTRGAATGLLISLGLVLAACGGSGASAGTAAQSATATGPITIWYSNNAEEVTWGEATVAA